MLIHALHAALEDAVEALNRVGMDLATAIFTMVVTHQSVLVFALQIVIEPASSTATPST